jgi:hypothetical protein
MNRNPFERGTPHWRKYNSKNKKDCPPDGVPLWQVLDPFMQDLSGNERRILIAEMTARAPHYIQHTPQGLPYIHREDEPRLSKKSLFEARQMFYHILPEMVVKLMPPHIREKYANSQAS